jgi:GTP pyrophosphokinase
MSVRTTEHVPLDRLTAAIGTAAYLHAGQVRKGTAIPYLAHLLGVASLVLEHGGDEEQAIAGLLHDAIEDAGGAATGAKLRTVFGDRVADLVQACTDADQLPKPPWQVRKEAYLAHLEHVRADALLVSLADKVHNVRAIAVDHDTHGDGLWSRFNGTPEQTAWYYRSLGEVFRRRLGATPLVRELELTIDRVWGPAPERNGQHP